MWYLFTVSRLLKPVPFYSLLKKSTITMTKNKALEKLFLQRSTREPLDIELSRNLYSKFIPKIDRLSILIERDLREWCLD